MRHCAWKICLSSNIQRNGETWIYKCLQINIDSLPHSLWPFTQVSTPCLRLGQFSLRASSKHHFSRYHTLFPSFSSSFLIQSFPHFCPKFLDPCSLAQMPHSCICFPNTGSNSCAPAHISPSRHYPCASTNNSLSPFCPFVQPGSPHQTCAPECLLPFSSSSCSSLSFSLPVGFRGCLPCLPALSHLPWKGPRLVPEVFKSL